MTDPTPPEVLAAREICAATWDNHDKLVAMKTRRGDWDNDPDVKLALAGIRAGLAMREAEVARLQNAVLKAAAWFGGYAISHQEQGKTDKAHTNFTRRDELLAAIGDPARASTRQHIARCMGAHP